MCPRGYRRDSTGTKCIGRFAVLNVSTFSILLNHYITDFKDIVFLEANLRLTEMCKIQACIYFDIFVIVKDYSTSMVRVIVNTVFSVSSLVFPDLDECTDGKCEGECENTVGSFHCLCLPGFSEHFGTCIGKWCFFLFSSHSHCSVKGKNLQVLMMTPKLYEIRLPCSRRMKYT